MHDHSHSPTNLPPQALSEKKRVALVSVIAATLLTLGKIVVGWWTGSLGILAEALHSGLDLAASIITLWAVRAAGKPADERHAYGHGKIENLSALFETFLLLATCAWIIKEAAERLFGGAAPHVQANVWSFVVVIGSIIVDFWRSRALIKVARKYQSQALEADAVHFSTDIASSFVVLIGLAGVLLAHRLGIPWLANADAISAVGVAGVVIWVSLRLGKRAIDDLLDAVPADLHDKISAAAKVPGVCDVRDVRVRKSGPDLFVDLCILVSHQESLPRSHAIASSAEHAIRHEFPYADVVVHVEPSESENENLLATARRIAGQHGAAAHNLVVHEEDGRWLLELHVEMPGDLPLAAAYEKAEHIEGEISHELPQLFQVSIHIEPEGDRRASAPSSAAEIQRIEEIIQDAPPFNGHPCTPQNLEIRRSGTELSLCFTCMLPRDISVSSAHEYTEKVERFLRVHVPEVGRIFIRTKPIF